MLEVFETDFEGDGDPEWTWYTTFDYDATRNLLSKVFEVDGDGDGRPDSVTTSTYTYDARGNLLLSVEEFGSNGVVVGRRTTTFVYDVHGNELSRVLVNQPVGFPSTTVSVTQTFDHRDQLITRLEEFDVGSDGSPEGTWETTNAYDVHGNLITSVVDHRSFEPGGTDFSITKTNTY